MDPYYGILDRNNVCGEKNEELIIQKKKKKMRNLVFHSINAKTSVFGKYRCFLQRFFSFKSSNAAITNYGFEFDSIVIVLDNNI